MKPQIPLALACTASLFSLTPPTPALAQADQPTLSSDVVVLGREKKQGQTTPVRLDLNLDLGKRFYFQGAGLNTRLAGQ